MLRCMECKLLDNGKHLSKLFGDNPGVLLNAQNPEADLSKKHVAIVFHVVREAIAVGIISP